MAICIAERNEIKDQLEDIKRSFDLLCAEWEECKNELSTVDKEICDILHIIENLNFNACQGYYLSKELKIKRKERRDIKNKMEQLQSIKNITNLYNNNLENALKGSIKSLKTVEERQKSRKYNIRIMTELEVLNEHANKQNDTK